MELITRTRDALRCGRSGKRCVGSLVARQRICFLRRHGAHGTYRCTIKSSNERLSVQSEGYQYVVSCRGPTAAWRGAAELALITWIDRLQTWERLQQLLLMSILCPTVISGEYFIPDTIAGYKENRMKEAGIVYAIQKIIASKRWNTHCPQHWKGDCTKRKNHYKCGWGGSHTSLKLTSNWVP